MRESDDLEWDRRLCSHVHNNQLAKRCQAAYVIRVSYVYNRISISESG